MANLVLEFHAANGEATTVVVEQESVIEFIHPLLAGREGEVLASVSLKETREELRREWRATVQLGRTELGFAEWMQTLSPESRH